MKSLKIITSQYQFSKVRPCLVPAFQWVTLNDVEISTEKPQGVIQSYISLSGICPSGKHQVINICAYPHTQCTHTCTQFTDMHADRPQQHITLPFVLFWLPASPTYFLSTLAFTFSFCYFSLEWFHPLQTHNLHHGTTMCFSQFLLLELKRLIHFLKEK